MHRSWRTAGFHMDNHSRQPGDCKRYAVMAYLTLFHSVATEFVAGGFTFAQIMDAAKLVGRCSHYLAGDPRIGFLLDNGHPIPGATHRLVDPHFLLPQELPAIQAKLQDLLSEIGDGDWVSDQINGFLNACATCVTEDKAMVITLS